MSPVYPPILLGSGSPGSNILIAEYAKGGMYEPMDLVQIYGCLCDRTRLRLLNLLLQGPLCVCHFQAILREPQVKISKHLGYLKRNGLVEAERSANLMIYRLAAKRPAPLRANLACLQDCATDERVFREDLVRLAKLRREFGDETPDCIRALAPTGR